MLGLSRRVRVFAYRAPTDMRKSFNTLAALVLEMGQDVVAGDAFLFVGKSRRRAKVRPCAWRSRSRGSGRRRRR